MRINQQNNNINRYKKTEINNEKTFKGGREVLRAFTDDALITTLALEVPCTTGRSANAYKRGGFPEFRERLTDDIISAVFWIKGVDMFNTIGDAIGKHVLKLPETEFDVGKDALRTPFENLVKDKAGNAGAATEKKLANKLSAFKFTKIAASAALAATFMGFVVPKMNYAITRKMMGKKTESKEMNVQNDRFSYPQLKKSTFEDFDKKLSGGNTPSFKGTGLLKAAYLLENNPICKMLASDVGMIAGRVTTARNKDEGREYFFRDTASTFFYYGSAPLVYKGLQKATKTTELTNIDAVCAKQLNENLASQLQKNGGKMTVTDFLEKTTGVLDDAGKALMEKLPFKEDVLPLDELKKHITDSDLLKKAEAMSKLQPAQAKAGSVLTKQQVADVLKNGSVNTPEFMHSVYDKKFGSALKDSYKFIPMKKITAFRDNIDDYVRKVAENATKENGGIVDMKFLDNIGKKSFGKSALFRTAALAVSAIGLAVIVPKMQYAITKKKTGSETAPGLREFEQNPAPALRT